MFLLFNSDEVLILTYSDGFDSSTDGILDHHHRTLMAIWLIADVMNYTEDTAVNTGQLIIITAHYYGCRGQQKGATDEDCDVCRQASYGLNQS